MADLKKNKILIFGNWKSNPLSIRMRKAVDCCAYSKPVSNVECKKERVDEVCKTHSSKETFHYCVVFSPKETYGIFQVESADEDVEAWTKGKEECFPDFFGCIHFETEKKLEIGERRKVVSLESINLETQSNSHFESFSTQGPVDECLKWISSRIGHYYGKEIIWSSSISETTHCFSDELHTEEFHYEDEEEDFLCWQFVIEYASGEVKPDPRL